MAKKSEAKFEFAQRPLKYRIAEGVSNLFENRSSNKKLDETFDRIIYFKTETQKTVVGTLSYLVFYNDSSIVCPELTPKQLKEIIAAKKGYIGFVQSYSKARKEQVNQYAVKALERAHSYPHEINLDLLIAGNAVIPLQ